LIRYVAPVLLALVLLVVWLGVSFYRTAVPILIDKEGRRVASERVDLGKEFTEGLLKAFSDRGVEPARLARFIDKRGHLVYPAVYAHLQDQVGMLPEPGKLVPWQIGDALCYLNEKGEVEVEAARPGKHAECFSEGLAAVATELKPFEDGSFSFGGWGFIDSTGAFVIEPVYEYALSFSEGLACVSVDGKYGYLDKTGNLAISCRFIHALAFSEGLAAVAVEEDAWGYIDHTGQMVIPAHFQWVSSFSEGMAAVEKESASFIVTGQNRPAGYIDKTGKEVIPPRFAQADPFSEGLAMVIIEPPRGGAAGYIDKTGEFVIPPQYFLGGEFHKGRAVVWRRLPWLLRKLLYRPLREITPLLTVPLPRGCARAAAADGRPASPLRMRPRPVLR
jgi:hypothetical protein